MTQLEDLLRRALTEMPTPETSVADPVARVQRRVRRAGLALAGGALAVAAAVSAAVVVPLSLSGGSNDRIDVGTGPLAHASDVTPWSAPRSQAVTYGDGSVWTLDRTTDGKRVVVRRDPGDGHTLSTTSVPVPADRIAFGIDRVWVYGGGDGASVDLSQVSSLDPSTGKVTTHFFGQKGGPSGIAFVNGLAWVTLANGDRVDALQSGDQLLQVASVAVPSRPTDIVSTGDGHLWVRESLAGRLADVDVGYSTSVERRPRLAGAVEWGGQLFGPAAGRSVWTTDGTRLVQLTPGTLTVGISVSTGTRIALPAAATVVVAGPPDGQGLWVGVSGDASPPWTLAYFSDAALRHGDPTPSATVDVSTLSALVDDPVGAGVVFVGADGTGRWSPPEAAG
jgi:hypothetical protein